MVERLVIKLSTTEDPLINDQIVYNIFEP